jgi:hypothetical protein
MRREMWEDQSLTELCRSSEVPTAVVMYLQAMSASWRNSHWSKCTACLLIGLFVLLTRPSWFYSAFVDATKFLLNAFFSRFFIPFFLLFQLATSYTYFFLVLVLFPASLYLLLASVPFRIRWTSACTHTTWTIAKSFIFGFLSTLVSVYQTKSGSADLYI